MDILRELGFSIPSIFLCLAVIYLLDCILSIPLTVFRGYLQSYGAELNKDPQKALNSPLSIYLRKTLSRFLKSIEVAKFRLKNFAAGWAEVVTSIFVILLLGPSVLQTALLRPVYQEKLGNTEQQQSTILDMLPSATTAQPNSASPLLAPFPPDKPPVIKAKTTRRAASNSTKTRQTSQPILVAQADISPVSWSSSISSFSTGGGSGRCPIVVNLDGTSRFPVTGETTSVDKSIIPSPLTEAVSFDLDHNGKPERQTWIAKQDPATPKIAFLVDNRDGNALNDMNGGRLFGDEGGRFRDGFAKLAMLDTNSDGKLSGDELKGVELWADDGDGRATPNEMYPLDKWQIKSLSTKERIEVDPQGHRYIRSFATTTDGKKLKMEDIWFATVPDYNVSMLQ